jgi:hypothetical protein
METVVAAIVISFPVDPLESWNRLIPPCRRSGTGMSVLSM